MGSLPTGTVTFLFMDIEGSTKLAQVHADRWENARDRHNSILRRTIESYNGFVFQVIGDAYCAAFHTAKDGLAAAILAQQKLQAEDWQGALVKVRMGLHTGSAELEGNDYHGYLTLVKVQRVMSVACGGQILLSNASAELLRSDLPGRTVLRDLKEHRLKGLLEPEHLWQVSAPGLQEDFPVLQSLNEIPNNLPLQLTTFIGRETEVGQIKKRLEKSRLVTLTGSGGVGKTRLSIRVASEVRSEYPNGVWFIELAPITDPSLVTRTVCSALDLTLQGSTSALPVLTDYLRSKKLLLVLDNCEHLIDECAHVCNSLLHECPDLEIIGSSREALGIDGENTYRVPSLSLPDSNRGLSAIRESEAVRLFIERATAVLPDFELTESNAASIAQICRHLDGIALAIELAASRVKILKVEQIASRLDDVFRLLTGGNRTALPRQQTLRAMIDWSYNLLPEEERTVLRRLSVFMGGWTIEAAEVVCDNSAMLDLLDHLVDKSLVSVDYEHGEEARYTFLETIRQYAREKLYGSGEGEIMRERQARWCVDLAERAEPKLRGHGQLEWLDRIEQELDNVRSALEWCINNNIDLGFRIMNGLKWFWGIRDHALEGNQHMERLMKAGHLDPTPLHAKSLATAASVSDSHSTMEQMVVFAEVGIKMSREVGDVESLAVCIGFSGLAQSWQGNCQ
jgi:predicted ATPase/class 3 adenylate cyclase